MPDSNDTKNTISDADLTTAIQAGTINGSVSTRPVHTGTGDMIISYPAQPQNDD